MYIINSLAQLPQLALKRSFLAGVVSLSMCSYLQAEEMEHMDHAQHMNHQNQENSLSKKYEMQSQDVHDHSQNHGQMQHQHSSIASKPITSNLQSQSNQASHVNHQKEHGGQMYQRSVFENKWMLNHDGQGQFSSELESWMGSDENKIYLKAHANKAESTPENYDVSAMYSRNVADFWDVQAGLRYRYDQTHSTEKNQVDAVFGIQGLAPYYFETDAYLYIGQDDQISFSLELERDVLLTQKLILKPYLDMTIIVKDESDFAKKTGFNQTQFGVETRYEINKRVMPFLDIAYVYDRGEKPRIGETYLQKQADWLYGAGLRLRF
ncbi:copper resistance protein B [Acinetobacter shaoyimingii]|uniref:Copper resistance protein B n=1 Tax=Acinetobacter shaoyimingii TaxID=2715164 RepID=A0A6G8RTM8_9GAMM|nr:copper resistance protein B [Acinetobacter shaoyimingii]QIO05180.1 copper resistance protein B [Acinetobacter shaoyimingii]